ncbi:MAG: hypothetical protein SF069_06155 [Phycisphaerae bacterium]|nr:hypothetical protein [Phycisphaerae bacterium]
MGPKYWAVPFILVCCGALLPAPARADGKAFSYDMAGMQTLHERSQAAIIDHADGRQRMRLSVSIDPARDESPDARTLWLFPVRGRGEAVRVKLLDEFSLLRGDDVQRLAARRLELFQTWSLTFILAPCLCLPTLGGLRAGREADVDVSQAIERFGMRCEVLAVDQSAGLVAHLTAAGVKVDEAQLTTFAPYFNADHSLIAIWIRSVAEFEAAFDASADRTPRDRHLRSVRTPCVEVDFPSQNPWFPLRPSFAARAAGQRGREPSDSVDLRLQVRGWVELTEAAPPDVFRYGPQYCTIDAVAAEKAGMKNGERDDGELRYTSFWSINSADQFTADLEFVPSSSRSLERAAQFSRLPEPAYRLLMILTIACICGVSGAVAGWMLMRRPLAGAAIGLANLATILGLLLILKQSKQMSTPRPDGTSPAVQKTAFAFAFVLTYGVLAFAVYRLGASWLGA